MSTLRCEMGDHSVTTRNQLFERWTRTGRVIDVCRTCAQAFDNYPDSPSAEPEPVTIYRRVGPDGVNGFAEHTHDGRIHGHDGGAGPHRHPLYPGDDRDQASAEPARVVDGLTVGARYQVEEQQQTAICVFLGRESDDGYYEFRDEQLAALRVGVDPGHMFLPVESVAQGDAIIRTVDGNRVDYWAEQARAFIAAERTRRMGTPADTSAYEPPTFHALPRVLDEQESTR